ncbi:hypothetical protein H8D36_04240 [archaeon]|nr:hypothetical protein [archaeon]
MKSKVVVGIGILYVLLLAVIIGATISELTPADEFWTNTSSINFSFTLSNYTNTTCVLIIDDSEEQSTDANANNIFTETLTEGEHSWMINCSSENNIESTIARTIYVDMTAPVIELDTPENEANLTNLTTVAFTATDNLIDEFNCTFILNGEEEIVSVEDGTEENIDIDVSEGTHYWNVSCADNVGNTKTSENRVFYIHNATSEDETEEAESYLFEIELDDTTFNPGEQAMMQILATNGSNVTLEIGTITGSWFYVVFDDIVYTSETYPLVDIMPYTNVSGDYVIDATMTHGNITINQKVNYTVNNNLNIDVDGDTGINKDEKTEIELDVSGGISPYTYAWELDDGGSSTKRAINFTYDEPGTYDNFVTVTDHAGNTKNTTIIISVKKVFKVKILVKDISSGLKISSAVVEIDGVDKSTNSNGETTFYLSKAYYEIFVSKQGYAFYIEDDYKVEANVTKTIELAKVDDDKPVISVISPASGAKLTGTDLDITFQVNDDADSVSCDIYTAIGNNEWFTKKKTVEISHTGNNDVTIPNMIMGVYQFKIECEDYDGNVGETNEISIEFVNESVDTNDIDENKNLVDELYDLLDGLPQRNAQQKQVTEALEFETTIKLAIKTVEQSIRDMYNVEYRRDIDDDEKIAKQAELMEKINSVYESTPVDIVVKESKSFVKYVKEHELAPIINEYAAVIGHQNKNALLKAAVRAQNKATVSTSVKNVDLIYMDGTVQEITIVIKDISYTNDTGEVEVIEYIPKSIAESVDELTIITDYEVVKEDPILKFNTPKRIVYYIEETKDVEEFEITNTIVIPASLDVGLGYITGKSIFSGEVNFSGKMSLIMLIIVLVLIYGGYHIDAFSKAKLLISLFAGNKNMHLMKMLINDAMDNIEVKNYDKELDKIYEEYKSGRMSAGEIKQLHSEDFFLCKNLLKSNGLVIYMSNKLNVGVIGAGRRANGLGEFFVKYLVELGVNVKCILGSSEKSAKKTSAYLRHMV